MMFQNLLGRSVTFLEKNQCSHPEFPKGSVELKVATGGSDHNVEVKNGVGLNIRGYIYGFHCKYQIYRRIISAQYKEQQ